MQNRKTILYELREKYYYKKQFIRDEIEIKEAAND